MNLIQSRKLKNKNHWLWHSFQDNDRRLCFESGWDWQGWFTTLSVISFTPNVEKKNKNLPRGNGENKKRNKWGGWCYHIPGQWIMLLLWYLVVVKEEDTQKTQKSKVSRTVKKLNQIWNGTEWLSFVSGRIAETYGTVKTGPFSSYSLPFCSEGLLSSLFLLFPAKTLMFFLLSGNLSQMTKLKTEPARREVSSFGWFSELNSSQWADEIHS